MAQSHLPGPPLQDPRGGWGVGGGTVAWETQSLALHCKEWLPNNQLESNSVTRDGANPEKHRTQLGVATGGWGQICMCRRKLGTEEERKPHKSKHPPVRAHKAHSSRAADSQTCSSHGPTQGRSQPRELCGLEEASRKSTLLGPPWLTPGSRAGLAGGRRGGTLWGSGHSTATPPR